MRTIAVVFVLVLGVASGRAAEEPLVQKVRQSLDKGVDFLKSRQTDQGGGVWNWENGELTWLQPGGTTNLVMLALLTAGVPADDPVIKRAVPYIQNLKPQHTYVVGLQTMVLAELGNIRDLDQIQKNVDWLISAAVCKGGKLGAGGKLEGWTYSSNTGRADNSNTQYALLGLHAGRQAGAIIPKAVWEAIHEFYVKSQLKPMMDMKGREMAGWNYLPFTNIKEEGTHTMTAAGLCGLYIAALEINDNKQGLDERTGVAKNCGVYPDDDAVAKGLRWMAQNFRFENRPHTFYNVYGIERVGRFSGQRFIGDHDWYREGCELLTGVAAAGDAVGLAQKPDGQWKIEKSQLDAYSILSTSFSVLFLAKGRTPILLSKFAWDAVGDRQGTSTGWNRKHNDVRHLAEYASREIFKKAPMAWQIFDARNTLSNEATFNDELSTLLQSPILYFNGHEAPNLTAAQKRLLRRYVDEGGFILAEACCGSEAFATGFKKLMEDKDVFGDTSPLLPLSPTHAIWSAHTLVPASIFQGEQVPENKKIMAIERGCKTVVVFSPQPLAGYWEEARFMPRVGEFVAKDDRAKLSYRLAGNIIAYATGFEPPKPRLEKPKIIDPKEEAPRLNARYMIELAQIRHDGGDFQPAKNALRNLAVNVRDKYLVDVSLVKQDIPMTKAKELFRHKFVYMHGKAAFTTDETEVENMRLHLEFGATLLADACCGSNKFDTAFRDFVRKMFPDRKLEVIPEDSFLYSDKLNGEAITKLRCRLEKEDGSPETNFKDVKPMLEGIQIDGRWVVIYSKYDIGCALEKNKSSACKGYEPESAMKLATAALLYSLKR